MAGTQAGNPFHSQEEMGEGTVGEGHSEESLVEIFENSEDRHNTNNDGRSINSTASEVTDATKRWWMENCEKKRLFICCDGTWQNASGSISPMSNVAKLARAVNRPGEDDYKYANPDVDEALRELAKEDLAKVQELDPEDGNKRVGLVRQLVYYSSGIGAQTALNVERGYSGLTGKGLESTILNAYCFICNNYSFPSDKDEIILVGFSRGAFAVRCLANFIDKVGLLRRKGLQFLRPLFDSWKKWGGADESKKAKLETELDDRLTALKVLRRRVKIRILAEWDTVSAIGLPLGRWGEKFSFVNDKVPGCVEHAFLALALDEKRRSFKPRQWMDKADLDTKVEQCAFVGCHSDIGGGNAESGLSMISFIWMISKIVKSSCAAFDERVLLQFMFPIQPERLSLGLKGISWESPKMELKNCAGATGLIQESFRGWWRIPWALSLGLWHGKRDKRFQKGDDDFKMKVHFTVKLLGDKSKCRLNKGYEYRDVSRSWEKKKTNGEIVLQEADISRRESDLYKEWIGIANHFQEQERRHLPLEDIDGDVNWTQVAEDLGWKAPHGKMEDGAIVKLVTPEIMQ